MVRIENITLNQLLENEQIFQVAGKLHNYNLMFPSGSRVLDGRPQRNTGAARQEGRGNQTISAHFLLLKTPWLQSDGTLYLSNSERVPTL